MTSKSKNQDVVYRLRNKVSGEFFGTAYARVFLNKGAAEKHASDAVEVVAFQLVEIPATVATPEAPPADAPTETV